MQGEFVTRSSAGLIVLLLALPAHAQVTGCGVNYSLFYNQVGAEPDANPAGIYATLRLSTSGTGDLESANVTTPNGNVIPLQSLDTVFYSTAGFSMESEMFDAYPEGEYIFSGSGGVLESVDITFVRPSQPLWSHEVPAFSPETVEAAQNVDPGSDLTLYFNSWTSDPEANEKYGILYIFDYQHGNALVYWAGFDPGQISHTIPAGTLPPDRVLTAQLFFSSRYTQYDRSVLTFAAYDRATSLDLHVTADACIGDLNNDGFVDDSDFVLFVAAYNLLDCADPTMPVGCPADFNDDGFVDDADFVLFVAAYNELICP